MSIALRSFSLISFWFVYIDNQAYGIACANVVQEEQEPSASILSEDSIGGIWARFHVLAAKAVESLRTQGFSIDSIQSSSEMNLFFFFFQKKNSS